MEQLPEALRPLAAYRQFVLYKIVEAQPRNRKIPICPHTLQAWPKGSDWQNSPSEWVDADTACALARVAGPDHGVGFLFTDNDPFFFVDVDDCRDENGWTDTAKMICATFPGAAIEVSQSGEGLHIFGIGTPPPCGHDSAEIHTQFYTSKRFVALTGRDAVGSAATDCSAVLPEFVAEYFALSAHTVDAHWTDGPVPEWSGPADDDALIKKMLSSKSAASTFSGEQSPLAALWAGDTSRHADDTSVADAALAQHLAFWTGSNCERIQRLMLRSGLVRDKWDRADYLERTILRAVSMQTEWYSDAPTPAEIIAAGPEPVLLEGYQYLGATQQLELFKGCTYVQDLHRVFTPSGAMLKQEQFNATYGGYTFQLTGGDSGKTTKRAWEAFTESQIIRYPKAESACFRPLSEPGALIEEEGRLLVNTYIPLPTPRKTGDIGPFLRHLSKLLPDERDRTILLSYMAACVQHIGHKFQWCPLIQGAEGNGKTLFTRCVAFAVGERYTHLPPSKEIAATHNAWLFGKLFIGVEDVFVQHDKQEMMETIKPMITNDRLARRAMGQDQVMQDVYANFMLNSNHQDGVTKTRGDRRFAPFFTAQQLPEDLQRDGMDGRYFPELYTWLKTDGYAIVNEYLHTYLIPDELNPAGACHRAPDTSSTGAAVARSLGTPGALIEEAAAEGQVGFRGGWVSSVALSRVLDENRLSNSVSLRQRRELMQALGYDYHPALTDGRTDNPIQLDGGKKPRLFIKNGHIHANLTRPVDVARFYVDAQNDTLDSPSLAFNSK